LKKEGAWGYFAVHPMKYFDAVDYFEKMLKDERVLIIDNDGKIVGIATYSVCNDFNPFYKKTDWDYLPHDPKGKFLYIEKIYSIDYNKRIRQLIELLTRDKYPQLRETMWHKYASWGDRLVRRKFKPDYKRRFSHV